MSYLHTLAYGDGEIAIVQLVAADATPDPRRFAALDWREFGHESGLDEGEFLADRIEYYEGGGARILVLDLDDLPRET